MRPGNLVVRELGLILRLWFDSERQQIMIVVPVSKAPNPLLLHGNPD